MVGCVHSTLFWKVNRVLRAGGLVWACIHLFTCPSGQYNITFTQTPLVKMLLKRMHGVTRADDTFLSLSPSMSSALIGICMYSQSIFKLSNTIALYARGRFSNTVDSGGTIELYQRGVTCHA